MKIGKLNLLVGLAAACSGTERCYDTYYPTTKNFVTDTNFEVRLIQSSLVHSDLTLFIVV